MIAFRLALRRSSTYMGGALVFGLCLYLALSERQLGLNLWSDLTSGLSNSSLLAGTVAAGFSAFESGRWQDAHRSRSNAAARGPLAQRLVLWGAAVLPIQVGYFTSLIVLWLYSFITSAYGRPDGWWLAAIAAALLLSSTFGWVLGAAGRGRWFVAPSAALLFYGLFVLLNSLPTSGGVRSLYPVVMLYDSVFVRHLNGAFALLILWFFVATLLLGLVGVTAPDYRLRLAGVQVGLLVIALMAAALVSNGRGQFTTGYNARDFSCSTARGVTLCLNRGYASAMPTLRQVVAAFNGRAAGTPMRVSKLEQNVEGIGDSPSRGSRSIYLEQISPDDIRFAVYRYVLRYGGTQACVPASENAQVEDLVNQWLANYFPDDGAAPKEIENLQKLEDTQGTEWFRSNYVAYASCSLKSSDLP